MFLARVARLTAESKLFWQFATIQLSERLDGSEPFCVIVARMPRLNVVVIERFEENEKIVLEFYFYFISSAIISTAKFLRKFSNLSCGIAFFCELTKYSATLRGAAKNKFDLILIRRSEIIIPNRRESLQIILHVHHVSKIDLSVGRAEKKLFRDHWQIRRTVYGCDAT